jgi:hypothetical protein
VHTRNTNRATLQIDDLQHQLVRIRTALCSYSLENIKPSNLRTRLVSDKHRLDAIDSREAMEDRDVKNALAARRHDNSEVELG